MRVVVQRVSSARVTVVGQVVGAIGTGLLLLVGMHDRDDDDVLRWVARKIVGMRIFSDEEGKMNHSLLDVGGQVLVVSQFTLYGRVEKGNRPSFIDAAAPEKANALYEQFLAELSVHVPLPVESGRFGAHMEVSLCNDGPVTLLIER